MCDINGPYTEAKEFTGYKVVIVDNHGHYYSPYTALRYTVGNVKPVDVDNLKSKYLTGCRIGKNKCMSGHTGVFINKEDAIAMKKALLKMYDNYNYCIIEMTIADNLQNASMGFWTPSYTIIGKRIVSMKRIK